MRKIRIRFPNGSDWTVYDSQDVLVILDWLEGIGVSLDGLKLSSS